MAGRKKSRRGVDARRARVSAQRSAKARQSRGAVSRSDSDGPSLQDLARSFVSVWREGLSYGTALDAEHAVSVILGMMRSMRSHPAGIEPWEALRRELPDTLAQMPDADAAGLLAGLSLMADDEQFDRACANALGTADPRAMVPKGFAEPRFVEAHIAGDVFGDQSMVVAVFEHPGDDPQGIVLLIDNCLQCVAGIIKDAWIATDPAAVLSKWDEVEGDNELTFSPRAIDGEELALLIARGLERFERFSNAPSSEEVERLHALLRSRVRVLGEPAASDIAGPHPGDDECDVLVEQFLGSKFASGLDRGTVNVVVGQMLHYVADYADGELLRWSPTVLGSCLLEWFPRKVILDGGDTAVKMVPDIVRGWVRFAGAERGLALHAIDYMIGYVDDVIAHEFGPAFSDDAAAGPAKAMLRGLYAAGIDPTDADAVGEWIDEINDLSIEERSRVLGMPEPESATPARSSSNRATGPIPLPSSRAVVQLKVTIKDTKPPVWRRILVPVDLSLGELHDVLQAAFGWDDCHLHEFEVNKQRIGMADLEDFEEPPADEHRYTLATFARKGFRFTYVYDFGDHWSHDIRVEEVLDPEEGMSYPALIGGRRACPPEDCGGTHGFANMLIAIADPSHEEYDSFLEWLGGSWNPVDPALAGFAERLSEQRAIRRGSL